LWLDSVQTMTEVAGDGHHIAQVVVVVAQDVGMELGRGAEGAARLPLRISASIHLLAKISGEGAKFRVEGAKASRITSCALSVGKAELLTTGAYWS
jgi:hypothetical protein